jgi:acetyltransferase-like isoleucine patch superfamily enzyme
VTDLIVIGAGKFAAEVTRYVDDISLDDPDGYRVECYLSVAGEPVHVPADRCVALEGFEPAVGARVVLALVETAQRRAVIGGFIEKYGLSAVNIVHPTSRIDLAQIDGVGNIVGPNCYFGVNVTLGSFNVVNYYCTIGHHSRIGSNNFIAPDFNCGSSVKIGDDNFFGLSCTIAPEVDTGSYSRFQAGITLFENAESGHSHLVPNRIKSVKSAEGKPL